MNKNNITESFKQPELYIFKDFERSVYPTWNKNNSLYDWDKIFQLESPIQYKDELIPTDNIVSVDVSNTWPDVGFIEQIEFKSSGYSIPYFHFLNQRGINLFEIEGEYEELMSGIDLNRATIPLINEIGMAINQLFDQLHRELNQIQLLNSEISDVVKVIFHESLLNVNTEAKPPIANPLNLFPELRHFIKDFIFGGANSDEIIPDWISVVAEKLKSLPKDKKNTISNVLTHFVKKREPHLCTSEILARKILILESAKKDILIGKATELDSYTKSQYPSPANVANMFKKRAPNSTHNINDIHNVMITTRNYIAHHKAKTLAGEVSKVIRKAKAEHNLDIEDTVIRNWINYYGEEALPLYNEQRKGY